MKLNHYTSTILKSFEILNCFDDDRQQLSIKDLSAMVRMPQSSVHRIVQSLELGGMLFQIKNSRQYRLGPKFLIYQKKTGLLNDYQTILLKHMEKLHAETGETVNLGILDTDTILTIHRMESTQMLRPSFSLHTPYTALTTAMGQVLLADLSPSAIQWVYEHNEKEIGLSADAFAAQLAQIQEDGYALDDEAFCPGLRCVAAPIRSIGGKAIFAISVSTPVSRMDDRTYLATRKKVVKAAAQITKEILACD